jgi:hypothetical protein
MPLAAVVTIALALVAALAIASCVAVMAVQLWQTSQALADVDGALAVLPRALDGMEPAMDTINGSLARISAATEVAVPVS